MDPPPLRRPPSAFRLTLAGATAVSRSLPRPLLAFRLPSRETALIRSALLRPPTAARSVPRERRKRTSDPSASPVTRPLPSPSRRGGKKNTGTWSVSGGTLAETGGRPSPEEAEEGARWDWRCARVIVVVAVAVVNSGRSLFKRPTAAVVTVVVVVVLMVGVRWSTRCGK